LRCGRIGRPSRPEDSFTPSEPGGRSTARPRRIVSGGQTGVDRAALDVALALGLECGGWCPAGRRAEDGPLAASYPLRETPSPRYEERTEWNVRDSDGTLLVTRGEPTGGTAITRELALRYGRPLFVANLGADAVPDAVWAWIDENRIEVLNVAGPRESGAPGIYFAARAFLEKVVGGSGPVPRS
jgi:hypothetical protein